MTTREARPLHVPAIREKRAWSNAWSFAAPHVVAICHVLPVTWITIRSATKDLLPSTCPHSGGQNHKAGRNRRVMGIPVLGLRRPIVASGGNTAHRAGVTTKKGTGRKNRVMKAPGMVMMAVGPTHLVGIVKSTPGSTAARLSVMKSVATAFAASELVLKTVVARRGSDRLRAADVVEQVGDGRTHVFALYDHVHQAVLLHELSRLESRR